MWRVLVTAAKRIRVYADGKDYILGASSRSTNNATATAVSPQHSQEPLFPQKQWAARGAM